MPADRTGPARCADLTTVPGKLTHFQEEPGGYLAQGRAAAARAFGREFHEAMAELTFLLVQPDAIARRLVGQCTGFLAEHGFVPVLAVPLTLTVPMARLLWRFQFNAKTDGSRALGELVYCRGPSLLLALRDSAERDDRSASTRLTELKGYSDPRKRRGGDLRSALGTPNRILRCVHSPDEPLDVLRETAVLVGEPHLPRFYERLAAGRRDGTPYDCRAAAEEVYAVTPPHDVDEENACRRLLARLDRIGGRADRAEAAERIAATVRRVGGGPTGLDWDRYAGDLATLGIAVDDWDALLVASSLVEYQRPGATKLIPSLSSP
ncbi:hypothetical protein [Actinophytocola sp. KF-1]